MLCSEWHGCFAVSDMGSVDESLKKFIRAEYSKVPKIDEAIICPSLEKLQRYQCGFWNFGLVVFWLVRNSTWDEFDLRAQFIKYNLKNLSRQTIVFNLHILWKI